MIPDNTLFITAKTGSWIKDQWRDDRSLGCVLQVNEVTGMMRVRYPKIGKDVWVIWENDGHYKVIN